MTASKASLAPFFTELRLSLATLAPYGVLLKPRVIQLVVFTALCTVPFLETINAFSCFMALLCIALGSGAAGAFNMWFDRDIDARMERTAQRPIPSGTVSPENALVFSLSLATFSVVLLGLSVSWYAAGWLAFSILFYAGLYTVVLKRATCQNIVIGGAAGALPPVILWAAMTGNVSSLLPWSLFLIVFFWTPPHFWALSLYRADDYARVGIPMLPVVKGKQSTVLHILLYTILLVGISLMPTLLGYVSWGYGAIALLLGLRFLSLAHPLITTQTDQQNQAARRLFGYSLIYLFVLFAALVLDKVLFSGMIRDLIH
ncbi:MAG: heme o synthase [Alphaproteobacteria bacterium]